MINDPDLGDNDCFPQVLLGELYAHVKDMPDKELLMYREAFLRVINTTTVFQELAFEASVCLLNIKNAKTLKEVRKILDLHIETVKKRSEEEQ